MIPLQLYRQIAENPQFVSVMPLVQQEKML